MLNSCLLWRKSLEWQYFSFRYKSCKQISINTDRSFLKNAGETGAEG